MDWLEGVTLAALTGVLILAVGEWRRCHAAGRVRPRPDHLAKLYRDTDTSNIDWRLPQPDSDGRVLLRTLDDGTRMYAAFYDWGPGHRHHWLVEIDEPTTKEIR